MLVSYFHKSLTRSKLKVKVKKKNANEHLLDQPLSLEFSLRLIEVTDNRNDFSCKGLLANISERRVVEHASALVHHLIDKVYIAPTT